MTTVQARQTRRPLRKLRELAEEGGFAFAGRRMLRSLAARLLWLERDVVQGKQLGGASGWKGRVRLEVRELDDLTGPLFQALLGHAESDEQRDKWLHGYARNGYHVLLALRDGEPIGSMWWVDASIPAARTHPHLQRFAIDLGEREAYLFDFFIRPEFRGGGHANEFLAGIEEALARRGTERIFGCVDVENKQARWLYNLCGWEDLREYRCWSVLSIFLVTNGALFVENRVGASQQGFDFRQVFPRPCPRASFGPASPDALPPAADG